MSNYPLRQLPIHAFLGEVEGVKSLALAAVFSSGGSRNVWMDNFGQVRVVNGYTRTTPVPLLSSGAGPTLVTALCHYVREAGSADLVRQEIAILDDGSAHYDVRMSADGGATWTQITDLVVAGRNPCGHLPDFAALGNILIITNGVNQVQFWDGTTLVASFQAQLAAPVLTAAGSGALEGNYQVRVVPMIGSRRKNGSVPSEVFVAVAGSAVQATWVADLDPAVTSYEVYSTTGSGRQYYLAGTTAAGVLTFTLTAKDLDLIQGRSLAEHGDAPPETRYCEIHKGRVFYGGLFEPSIHPITAPRTWWFSDPGLPDSVYQDTSFVNATDAESFSDATVGGTGNFHDMFVIWLERSIWTLTGSLEQVGPIIDAKLTRTNAKTGSVSHRTVVRIPAGSKYTDERSEMQTTRTVLLAYLTPLGDIRLFDGNDDTIISTPMKNTLDALTYAIRGASYVVEDERRGEVTWVLPTGINATRANTAVTWNYRYGIWYERPLWSVFGCAITAEAVDDPASILAADNRPEVGALVYRLWQTGQADGVDYLATWMSKSIYFPGLSQNAGGNAPEGGSSGAELISYDKRVRWVDILFTIVSSFTSLLVEWFDAETDGPALGSTIVRSGQSVLETSDGDIITTADGSPITAAKTSSIVRARLEDPTGRYMHGRGVRLRLSANANG